MAEQTRSSWPSTISRLVLYISTLFIAIFFSMIIVGVYDYLTRTDPLRGEMLMMLPGGSMMTAFFGLFLVIAAILTRRWINWWEYRAFVFIGIVGVLTMAIVWISALPQYLLDHY